MVHIKCIRIWLQNNVILGTQHFFNYQIIVIHLRMIQNPFILLTFLWIGTNDFVHIHLSFDMWSSFGHCFPLPQRHLTEEDIRSSHTQELWRRLWMFAFSINSKYQEMPQKPNFFTVRWKFQYADRPPLSTSTQFASLLSTFHINKLFSCVILRHCTFF